MDPVFRVSGLTFRYAGASRPAVADASFEVTTGSLFAILGPNGSGKSTLLRLMLGELSGDRGTSEYAGRPVKEWRRRAMAREVAFVPQDEPLAFPMKVRELVRMGRYPHVGVLGRSGPGDAVAVDAAMERAGIAELADRFVATLSGGERQRARIARALAQQPRTMVLDEPTAALDLHFEMETFELMQDLTAHAGITVVVATHNLNLASRFASRVLLLAEGRTEAEGTPRDVFTHDTMERVYRWPVLVSPHPGPGPDAGAPQITPLSRER